MPRTSGKIHDLARGVDLYISLVMIGNTCVLLILGGPVWSCEEVMNILSRRVYNRSVLLKSQRERATPYL
jgi:hypothetical protein